jgi:hypothetical protein
MNYRVHRLLLVAFCLGRSSLPAPAAELETDPLRAVQLDAESQSAFASSTTPGRVRLENSATQRWGRDKKVSLNASDNLIDATSSLMLDGGELHLDDGQLTVNGTLEIQSGSRLRVRRGKLNGSGRIRVNKGGVLELANDTVPRLTELARYRGNLSVVNYGSIYGRGVIDGDLTVASSGSIALSTQPPIAPSTATLLPTVFTSENQGAFSTVQTLTADPTLIVVVGGLSVSGTVYETITPTAYGRMTSLRSVNIYGATLNISLTTDPATAPFTFPIAGQQFDIFMAPVVNVYSNFVPSPFNDNSPNFHFTGARVLSNPFAPGYQAYLLTTQVTTP